MPDPWVQEIWLQRQRYSVKYRIVDALMLRGYDIFEFELMLLEIEELIQPLPPAHHDQIREVSGRLDRLHEQLTTFRHQNGLFSQAESKERTEQ